ncbi:MAG: GDP-mannose 4,6-dehydratase [Dehalococcoidia bacterium]|nr:MAG: GDP-mannose 4,6-dehydratase [Dehalococcoidia bacterium]
MNVLITGLTGLVGSHLAEYLLSQPGVKVFGFKRWRSDSATFRHLVGKIEIIEGDIEDRSSVERAIALSQPDRIFHLAAQSYPSESWDAPALTVQANVLGTINLLETVRHRSPNTAVHIAGSSAEYGFIRPEDCPIPETLPLRPLSPYGVSKVAQELLAYQYHVNFGLRTFITRSFNHIGPRQGERTAVQTFCKQVAEIEAGLRPPVVRVGNLTPRRDFTDVLDVCRALWLLMERGRPGEPYNLCSGNAPVIGDVLQLVLSKARVAVTIEQDPARLRPSDEPILLGDNTKLRTDTGWTPEISLSESLDRILAYWRSRLAEEAAARVPV